MILPQPPRFPTGRVAFFVPKDPNRFWNVSSRRGVWMVTCSNSNRNLSSSSSLSLPLLLHRQSRCHRRTIVVPAMIPH